MRAGCSHSALKNAFRSTHSTPCRLCRNMVRRLLDFWFASSWTSRLEKCHSQDSQNNRLLQCAAAPASAVVLESFQSKPRLWFSWRVYRSPSACVPRSADRLLEGVSRYPGRPLSRSFSWLHLGLPYTQHMVLDSWLIVGGHISSAIDLRCRNWSSPKQSAVLWPKCSLNEQHPPNPGKGRERPHETP